MSRLTLAVVLCVIASGTARSEDSRPVVDLPYTYTLGIGEYFYLHGERLSSTLEFAFQFDTLFVNARAIKPAPSRPTSPEESDRKRQAILQVYGGVPLFQRLLDETGDPVAAKTAFEARIDSMVVSIGERWRILRDEVNSRDDVPRDSVVTIYVTIADSALTLLDPEIVGDVQLARERSSITPGGLLAFPTLISSVPEFRSQIDQPRQSQRSTPLSLEAAVRIVDSYRSFFAGAGQPTVILVSYGGVIRASGQDGANLLEDIDAVQRDPTFKPTRLSPGQAADLRRGK